MRYLLDSNVFIQAKNMQYPFDVFPGFWDWLKRDMEAGIIASISPIFQELSKGNDSLLDWINGCKDCGCFLPVDDISTQSKFSEIATWTFDPDRIFKQTAQAEFLAIADSWLVAKAATINATIVTHETYDPHCKIRVKIPNACRAFGVEYIDVIELTRRLGVKFRIA
jgi:hypothetical protein